jgi:hypothetical protein
MVLGLPRPAQAQDITVFVVALAPPILLAPLCLAFVRWLWLGRGVYSPARNALLFVVSCVDILLWIALIASVLLINTGDFTIGAVVVLVVACGALWMLSCVWFDPSQKTVRWIFLASPALVLGLLAAATWLVLLAVCQ